MRFGCLCWCASILLLASVASARPPDVLWALRIEDAPDTLPRTRDLARRALEDASPGGERTDGSAVLDALWGPFLEQARVDDAFKGATRTDVAAALRRCARDGVNADAESSFCRRELVDVLWRRHGAHVDAATVIVVHISRHRVDPLVAAVDPGQVAAGPTWSVWLHAARRGAAGRMVQLRRVSDVADAIRRGVPALLDGQGMVWSAWPAIAGDIPPPPPPPPTVADVTDRLEAAAQAAQAVAASDAVAKRSWCRGPLPATLRLEGTGPMFSALVAKTYAEARRAGLARWRMESRSRTGTDPLGEETGLTCRLTLDPAAPTAIPGSDTVLPERVFFTLGCGAALPKATGVIFGSVDDAASSAAAVVDSALQQLCLRS
jgi:hypothetical protein